MGPTFRILFPIGWAILFSFLACSAPASGTNLEFILSVLEAQSPTGVFFDDFSYLDRATASGANGWNFRTLSGGPGPAGASWDPGQMTFGVEGADTYLRLSAVTQGSAASTIQSEISTGSQKFFQGTYAARIRFFDSATTGSSLDQVNQTFFTIAPLNYGGDPNYSECDFEYLGQGGWGETGPTMFFTTWETYNPTANFYDDISQPNPGTRNGWHILVLQISESYVKYYIDGNLIVTHEGKYVPESPMTISFNVWFLSDTGALDTSNTSLREYEERVDWIYFVKNRFLSPAKVQEEIDSFRTQSVATKDTVPN